MQDRMGKGGAELHLEQFDGERQKEREIMKTKDCLGTSRRLRKR